MFFDNDEPREAFKKNMKFQIGIDIEKNQKNRPPAFRFWFPVAITIAAAAFIFGVGCGKNQDRRSQLNLRNNLNSGSKELFAKTSTGLSAELNAEEFFDKMPAACKTEPVKSLALQSNTKSADTSTSEDSVEIFDCETMGQIAVLKLRGESAQNLFDGLAIREESENRQEVFQKLEKLGKTGRPKGRTARELLQQRIDAKNKLYDRLNGHIKERRNGVEKADLDDSDNSSKGRNAKSAMSKSHFKLAQDFACRMIQDENAEDPYECIFKFQLKTGTFIEALSEKGVLLAGESLADTSELSELSREEISSPNVSMFQFSGKNPCKSGDSNKSLKMFQVNFSGDSADLIYEELDGKGKDVKIEKGFTEDLCKEKISVTEKRGTSITCRKSTDKEDSKSQCYILGSLETGKLTAKTTSKENRETEDSSQGSREKSRRELKREKSQRG